MRYHRSSRVVAPARSAGLLTLILVASWVGACVPVSVAPFVAEEDAIELPGLAGTWLDEDGDTTVVSALGDGEYELDVRETVSGAVRRTVYRARAGRFGTLIVLDVWPHLEENPDAGITEIVLGSLIPGHVLIVLEQDGEVLRYRGAEADSLDAALRTGVLATPVLELDGRLVMTAPTESLRAAFLRYMERPGALSDWLELRRIPDR